MSDLGTPKGRERFFGARRAEVANLVRQRGELSAPTAWVIMTKQYGHAVHRPLLDVPVAEVCNMSPELLALPGDEGKDRYVDALGSFAEHTAASGVCLFFEGKSKLTGSDDPLTPALFCLTEQYPLDVQFWKAPLEYDMSARAIFNGGPRTVVHDWHRVPSLPGVTPKFKILEARNARSA